MMTKVPYLLTGTNGRGDSSGRRFPRPTTSASRATQADRAVLDRYAAHAWDISQSCGRCLPIPDEPANDLLERARLLVPRLGRYPLFAAPAPAPARATSSDRLTAYLGRPVRNNDPLAGGRRTAGAVARGR